MRRAQAFVNQLQMALFTWIKQNPRETPRLYALDEAQNFAPATRMTACKASVLSALRPVAQIWARDDFRDSAPERHRQCARVQLRDACLWQDECAGDDRGGAGADVRQGRGRPTTSPNCRAANFITRPRAWPGPRKSARRCVSAATPANPPTQEQIIEKARRQRER